MPRGGPSSASFCAVAVGIAEGCLETYYKYTRPRKSRGRRGRSLPARRSSQRPRRPRSRPRCGCIRARLREAMGVLERKEPFTKHRQVHGKRNMAYAAQLSIQAVQTPVQRCRRARALSDQEMQRKFRDAHAAAAHHSLNWHSRGRELWRACAGRGCGRVILSFVMARSCVPSHGARLDFVATSEKDVRMPRHDGRA